MDLVAIFEWLTGRKATRETILGFCRGGVAACVRARPLWLVCGNEELEVAFALRRRISVRKEHGYEASRHGGYLTVALQ